MYFPTSAARQLSTVPALPNLPPELVVQLVPSPRKDLFCLLTRNGIAIWRVRPPAILAYLSRTPISLTGHGENELAYWSPDGMRIAIQSTQSCLVLVSLEYNPDEMAYQVPILPPTAQRNFLPGAGEGSPLQSLSIHFEGVIRVEGHLLSVSPRRHHLLLSTRDPPAIQQIAWPTQDTSDEEEHPRSKPTSEYTTWILPEHEIPWLIDADVVVSKIVHSRSTGVDIWQTSDGRAYFVRLIEETSSVASSSDLSSFGSESQSDERPNPRPQPLDRSTSPSQRGWYGTCIHHFEYPKWIQKRRKVEIDQFTQDETMYQDPRAAVEVAVNTKFSLVAVGTYDGSLQFTDFPLAEGVSPRSQAPHIPNHYGRKTGRVCAMEWSSDGYVLAVGWQNGWAIFSVGGRCLAWGFGVEDSVDERKYVIHRFQDIFMFGIRDLFWAPGNFELVVLAQPSPQKVDGQLFVIPFAKSATTGQHSPDNTRYAFLQMDDRALIYRGVDQPDMSVINPESDVWQHVKIPQSYLAKNCPVQYSSLSSDGRLVAVAGRRGLTHYSTTSGRWKLFSDKMQEQAFSVRGGLIWFHHVLIAAVEVSKSYQIRLYSRDLELSNQNVLHREVLLSPVVILSLVDNSLLVYTADNTLSHFLIIPTKTTIVLHLCGSITFDGIIASPSAVTVLSWMIPTTQKRLGDPVDDLSVATVLMVVGGQLVLLRPRRSRTQEVKYDMQIFADRIEFCWTHLRGIGALENSLWGYDGQGLRVWLNALAIESPRPDNPSYPYENIKESANIPLDFYPLSVLMDKGIIIGAEHEAATRSNLPFVMFRHATSSHLFLHHILLFHLEACQVPDAVLFAAHYQNLVYFPHALEILLHTVVESESALGNEDDGASQEAVTPGDTVLPAVVEFLDYFDAALEVIVGCARKTEMTRWRRLFNVVGNPKALFEICLTSHRLKTAASYLLVLHNLEQLDERNGEVDRLLQAAVIAKDWQLCRELMRFLHSIDETGAALRDAVEQAKLLELPVPDANGLA